MFYPLFMNDMQYYILELHSSFASNLLNLFSPIPLYKSAMFLYFANVNGIGSYFASGSCFPQSTNFLFE